MTILTMYYKNSGGGFFKRLCRLITACAEAGITVHYLSPAPFPSVPHGPDVIWHKAWISGPQWLQKLQCACLLPLQVFCLCVRHRIQRIAVFSSAYAAVSLWPRLLLRTPIITFIRSYWVHELTYRKAGWISRTGASLMDHIGLSCSRLVVPNSYALHQTLLKQGVKPAHLTILPNDVVHDPSVNKTQARNKLISEHQLPDDAFIMAYIGTFKTMKRAWLTVDLLHQLDASRAYLLIAGDGVDKSRIEQRIAERGLAERCRLIGWQEDPSELYAAADVTLLPSAFEGSPNAILESFAYSTPVLGATAPGIEEMLPAEFRFSPDNLTPAIDTLRRLMKDPEEQIRARTLIEELRKPYTFDWNAKATELITTLCP